MFWGKLLGKLCFSNWYPGPKYVSTPNIQDNKQIETTNSTMIHNENNKRITTTIATITATSTTTTTITTISHMLFIHAIRK